jgi:hypothetical protein
LNDDDDNNNKLFIYLRVGSTVWLPGTERAQAQEYDYRKSRQEES